MMSLSIINYDILTFEVIKGQYRSKNSQMEKFSQKYNYLHTCPYDSYKDYKIYIILTSEFIKGHYRSDLTYKNCDISPKTFGLEVGETIPLLLRY